MVSFMRTVASYAITVYIFVYVTIGFADSNKLIKFKNLPVYNNV